ncbi:MAG: homoserine dehydrogenase, partial [Candidatus Thermoplasmatota archaeon]|nr:homoserine dehydrogenase [Candidatus Thermoplasmatota archaeon]
MQKLALIGCGVVGQGLLKILIDKGQMLKDRYGYEAQVVAVSDKFKGAVMCKDGIPLDKLLAHLEQNKPLGELAVEGATYGLDPVETIRQSNSDVVVEISFTDVKTGEPAATYMREAFKSRKHVATTNKGPAALFYKELSQLAQENDVLYKIEGTVMSGTPVFSLIDYALAGNTVTGVKGILNGTTNFILTKMEMESMPYPEALALAQKLGYAEADPTADVEGFDALAKVLILSNVVLGASIKESDVDRE